MKVDPITKIFGRDIASVIYQMVFLAAIGEVNAEYCFQWSGDSEAYNWRSYEHYKKGIIVYTAIYHGGMERVGTLPANY
jgi:hypothetical protein